MLGILANIMNNNLETMHGSLYDGDEDDLIRIMNGKLTLNEYTRASPTKRTKKTTIIVIMTWTMTRMKSWTKFLCVKQQAGVH